MRHTLGASLNIRHNLSSSKGPMPLQLTLLTTYIPKTSAFTLAFSTSQRLRTTKASARTFFTFRHYITPSARNFFFLFIPPPPRATLFPYTTLFRSGVRRGRSRRDLPGGRGRPPPFRRRRALPLARGAHAGLRPQSPRYDCARGRGARGRRDPHQRRSEEHTSELQSHVNLVCRLLLE